jgi:hypothetical protein
MTPAVSGPMIGRNSSTPPIAANPTGYGTPARKNTADHTTNVIKESRISAPTHLASKRWTSSAMSRQSSRCRGSSMRPSIPATAGSASFRMKNAKMGTSTHHPGPRQPPKHGGQRALHIANDLCGVGTHRPLDLPDPPGFPAALLQNVCNDLTARDLLGHLDRLLGQQLHFLGEARAHLQPGPDEGEQQQVVDNTDRQRASAPAREPALDHAHDGKDQVREEEREDEQEERPPEQIYEADGRHEHEDGPATREARVLRKNIELVYPPGSLPGPANRVPDARGRLASFRGTSGTR